MNFINKSLICLSIFMSFLAFASEEKDFQSTEWFKEIKECFETSYDDPSIYDKGWCNRNSIKLYKKCFQPHEDKFGELEKGNVLFFIKLPKSGEWSYRENNPVVYPVCAKNNAYSWVYHSFLEFNGLIFDLDFTDDPKIIGVEDYLDEMFEVDFEKNEDKYAVRVITVDENLKHFEDDKKANWAYFLRDKKKVYPIVELLEYLDSIIGQG